MALAAIVVDKTIAELAVLHDFHLNQITEWKRQLANRAADVFGVSLIPHCGSEGAAYQDWPVGTEHQRQVTPNEMYSITLPPALKVA